MVGAERLLSRLSSVVKRARADAVSVCAHAQTRQVFRFAYGAVHQSLRQDGITITAGVIRGRRLGVSSTDTLEASSLSRCLHAAGDIARHAPETPYLPELPAGRRFASRDDVVEATARASAPHCLDLLTRVFRACQGAGVDLAGSFVTGTDEFCVANSNGLAAYAASTVAGIKLVTMYRALSGYASGVHRDLSRLDVDALLRRSMSQSLSRREPVRLPLGTYEVILEPDAVAELLTWLGYTAFGAKSVEERTSVLAGRMGDRLFSPLLTITDDATDPQTLRMPFDFEGTPKRRTVLIDRGRAAGLVYDTTYGRRFGQASTGHGMAPGDTEGPLPLHLDLAAGDTGVAEIIRSCKRGILIPRFHYVNGLLNPREALMTGLTREGTCLIEDGAHSHPLRTMRFTHSLLDAFRRVLAVSKERQLVADPAQEAGCVLAPTLRLAALTFTGHSET